MGNIQGLRSQKQADKLSQLARLAKHDHLLCINETNLLPSNSSLLVKGGLGDVCRIKALSETSYPKEMRIHSQHNGRRSRKKSGLGTSMVSRRPDIMSIGIADADDEIVFVRVGSCNCSGLVLTGYRSPSSEHQPDIENFIPE